ncbi:MAG: protein kinase, partial [Planctomycetota bacterium]|nr:protein kinase [Planctomycetota bacterium]
MKEVRDLLIGLFAVELKLITREQLSRTFHEWTETNAGDSFGAYLLTHELIVESDRLRIEAKVDAQLETDEHSVRSAVWKALMHAAAQNDDDFGSGSIQDTINNVFRDSEAAQNTIDYDPTGDATHMPESFGRSDSGAPQISGNSRGWIDDLSEPSRSRYSRTRVHSQGGLGRVWLARDQHLNREVALKEIRRDRGVNPEKIRRFMREAQITGQLEHPNIIPVYELESDGAHGPFYTMKFMRGETLAKRITNYHNERQDGESNSLPLTQLLASFVGICHAIAYAHSRGVIHRDLKPDNVMIGAFGEVIVLDWGLAKTAEEAGDEVSGDASDKSAGDGPAVEVVGDAAIDKMEHGQVIGTPRFMAPEQAEGSVKLMGPATDIYGLGAVLFAILTSQAPHRFRGASEAKSTRNLLTQIATEESPSARAILPSVPKALDAICKKAMARLPGDRYDSALDVANDVQRWLADEPVSVHRAPIREKLLRWMRRHKAWTMASAVALLVVSLVSMTATIVVAQARDAAVEARGEAEAALIKEQLALAAETEARQEATRMLRKAREAVDRSFTGVSMVLKNFPGMQWLRIELLKQAAGDYEGFAREKGTLPELRLETARAFSRLGEVQNLIGDTKSSEAAYRSAETNYRELLPLLTDDESVPVELAGTLSMLGSLYTNRNEFPTAGNEFDAALTVIADVETTSDATRVKSAKAAVLLNSATLLAKIKQYADAEQRLQDAKSVFKTLARTSDDARHLEGLAAVHIRLGKLHIERRRFESAIVELKAGSDVYRALRQGADEPRFLEGLATCQIDIGNAFKYLGDDAEAIKQYAEAVQHFNTLLVARPGVPYYREMIAVLGLNVAQIRTVEGRNEMAKQLAESAFHTFDELILSTPDDLSVPQYLLERGASAATLAMIHRDLQSRDADGTELARKFAGQAIDDFTKLRTKFPEIVDYQHRLGVALTDAARGLAMSYDLDAAAAAELTFANAVSVFEGLIAKDPDDKSTQDKFATACLHFADLLSGVETRQADAAKLYEKAIALRRNVQETAEQLDRHA